MVGSAKRYPRNFLFLLVENFSAMPFTSALEPLRVANRMSGERLYRWKTASIDGAPVRASNDMQIQVDQSLMNSGGFDAIVVCAGLDVFSQLDERLNAILRRLRRMGIMVGSVCTGSAILAHAGLLDGQKCTTHWEDIELLAEKFPNLHVTRSMFEIADGIFTCSGGTAPLDLMLHFIREDFATDLASMVADQLLHHLARKASEPQRLALRERTGVRHEAMLDVISAMEDHVEDPLTLKDLAQRGQMSLRQLERLFLKELNTSPLVYYRALRLKRARALVRQSAMTIMQIAVATGFGSATHFARVYRGEYGLSPSEERGLRR